METLIEKETQNKNQETTPPGLYNVIFINDDYSTFDFVIYCLESVFNKTRGQSIVIAQTIHSKGKGVVGTYSKDIALTKQEIGLSFAHAAGHPLQIIVEKSN